MLNTPGLTVIAAPVEDLILGEVVAADHDLMKKRCQGIVLGKLAWELLVVY